MVVLLGNPVIAIVAIIVSIETNRATASDPPLLPNTYKDVFAGGSGGRPTFGSTSSTCWARGGMCIDLRDCRESYFDATVTGCTRGFKVCCKMFKLGPPTVGPSRRDSEVTIYSSSLKELDKKLMKNIAMKNNDILWNYLNNILKKRRI